MFCKYCGKEIDNTAKFCNYCGQNLIEELEKISKEQGFWESYKERYNENYGKKEKERIKEKLKPKDGKKHIIDIGNISAALDSVIEMMQDEGYEIIDIKRNRGQISGSSIIVETWIIYK